MVQGEKNNMLTVSSYVARTSDPFARKAGFEAMHRAEKSSTSSSGFGGMMKQTDKNSSKSSTSSSSTSSNGAWGPVFQNKQNFASMHFC